MHEPLTDLSRQAASSGPESLVAISSHTPDEPLNDCWNRIGIRGDRSCPTLLEVVHCHNCPVFSTAAQHLLARPLPAETIRERSAMMRLAPTLTSGETLAFVVFRVGEEWLALDVQRMVEVAEPRVIHRIPHRRDRLLRGLVNIRGDLQLCFSTSLLLEIDTDPTPQSQAGDSGWLLVTEYAQQRWVLSVDEVKGVRRMERESLTPVPATIAHGRQSFSQSIGSLGDQRVGVLDADRVFSVLMQP